MAASETMRVQVLTLSGGCFDIEAEKAWSTKALKCHITSLNGVAHYQQKILFGSRILCDADLLAEVFANSTKVPELMLVCCQDPKKTELLTSLALGHIRLNVVEEQYLEDYDIVEAAVYSDGMNLQYARGAPRRDRKVILKAVAKNGYALAYAQEFSADPEVVLAAVKSNSFAITQAHPTLQRNPEFAAEAVKHNPFVQDHLDKTVKEDHAFRARIEGLPISKTMEDFDVGRQVRVTQDLASADTLVVKAGSVGRVLTPDERSKSKGKVLVLFDRGADGEAVEVGVLPGLMDILTEQGEAVGQNGGRNSCSKEPCTGGKKRKRSSLRSIIFGILWRSA